MRVFVGLTQQRPRLVDFLDGPVSPQGLVLGVFEKEAEEQGLHLTEAAAGFDTRVSGKLCELLNM